MRIPRRLAPGPLALLLLALLAREADSADPFQARVHGLTDVPYPTFQGFDCVSLNAPRTLVWRVLAGAEGAATWLLPGLDNVVPRGARYRKGPMAEKDDVLVVDADTVEGPRHAELRVLVAVPGRLLSFSVTPEGAVPLGGASRLVDTFVLEENGKGTDLYWANHFDPDSPLAAALSGLNGGRAAHRRRELGLLVLEGRVRAAAEAPAPPLHDVRFPK